MPNSAAFTLQQAIQLPCVRRMRRGAPLEPPVNVSNTGTSPASGPGPDAANPERAASQCSKRQPCGPIGDNPLRRYALPHGFACPVELCARARMPDKTRHLPYVQMIRLRLRPHPALRLASIEATPPQRQRDGLRCRNLRSPHPPAEET